MLVANIKIQKPLKHQRQLVLDWGQHVSEISCKATKTIGFLWRKNLKKELVGRISQKVFELEMQVKLSCIPCCSVSYAWLQRRGQAVQGSLSCPPPELNLVKLFMIISLVSNNTLVHVTALEVIATAWRWLNYALE